MQAVGFVTDAAGRRMFAIVPVGAIETWLEPAISEHASPQEKEAYLRLVGWAGECLEHGSRDNCIKTERLYANTTQDRLAKAMGVSQATICRLEKSSKIPPKMMTRALEGIRTILAEEAKRRPTVDDVATLPDPHEEIERRKKSMA